MTVLRTKGLCTKVTEEEYARFERAGRRRDPQRVSSRHAATPPADPVVAELLAFRTIVLNLLCKIANRQAVTADVMKRVIGQADGERVRRVHERLAR